jgi:hypothetical protein
MPFSLGVRLINKEKITLKAPNQKYLKNLQMK